MLKLLPIAILSCFGLMGCRKATTADIVGTWVVTDQSRQVILPASQRSAAEKIVLASNGTFDAYELPEDLLYIPPEVADRLVTGSGTWKLSLHKGRQEVTLQFNTITNGQRGNVPYVTTLYVSTGLRSTVGLYYFQGDPDEGRMVEFEKK